MSWLKVIQKAAIGAIVAGGACFIGTGINLENLVSEFVAAVVGAVANGGINWVKHQGD